MRFQLSLFLATFILAGCTSHQGVSPSQNASLQAVSPNTPAASQGGAMQRSLDTWLKEDWIPNSVAPAAPGVVTSNAAVAADTVVKDEKPFTLQSYADKWKVYHENKEKMDEGKPKEASHIESIQKMPVIGK